ncbi:MAG: HIT domain-containing protein [Thermodesulfobacteriota bacterium]|nr:HIT domain-containing protein [Thermodesulfobacteriota bacterium]
MKRGREKPRRNLWAPWRMNYILREKKKGCIFCRKPKEDRDEENLILYQGRYAFIMMNRFPYNSGHLMVIPKRHSIDLEHLNDLELKELFYLLRVSIQALKTSLFPQGFNIGVNIGEVGGAGEDHIHFHIVPRWAGDTNFMPILGETKIIPEYLENTYQKLHSAFRNHMKKRKRHKGGEKK